MERVNIAKGPIVRGNPVARGYAALLPDLPLFRGMAPSSMRQLLCDASVQRFARNTVLFIQDDPATRVFVILDGWVKLFRETSEGNESIIAILSKGESFAEAAFFQRGTYPVSAMAVEDSRLLILSAEHFRRRLRVDGHFAQNLISTMARHMLGLMRQVEQLAAKSSAERLAEFVVGLCPPGAEAAIVALPLDKALIAGRLGMQPETFSRALKKLARLGVVSRRDEISVPDVAALRAFSEGQATVWREPLCRRA